MQKAVFVDRDGVINRLVWNPSTGEFESPHHVRDMELFPRVLDSLRKLQDLGYLLYLISNQPSYAKGKTTLENIREIHDELHRRFEERGIRFAEYFYCYHHPNGVVSELTGPCRCRKPGTLFLEQAHAYSGFSVPGSWLVGDQDSDILCGQGFGLRTIQIQEQNSSAKRGASRPDFVAQDLAEAVKIIEGHDALATGKGNKA